MSSCRDYIVYILIILYIIYLLSIFTLTTQIHTLSLHDALPICIGDGSFLRQPTINLLTADTFGVDGTDIDVADLDRKSTRLNSSHLVFSYAVFCLKKKK